MNGYIPPQRTREIEATFEAAEGAEPFRATIVTSLTFAEVEAIPFHSEAKWNDIFKAIAPYVLAWNAMGRNPETGQYEPIPAPAEGGWLTLRAVDMSVSLFLAEKLKTVYLGDTDARKKESTPSDDTPDGRRETKSASKRTTRRKSQSTTTDSPGSI